MNSYKDKTSQLPNMFNFCCRDLDDAAIHANPEEPDPVLYSKNTESSESAQFDTISLSQSTAPNTMSRTAPFSSSQNDRVSGVLEAPLGGIEQIGYHNEFQDPLFTPEKVFAWQEKSSLRNPDFVRESLQSPFAESLHSNGEFEEDKTNSPENMDQDCEQERETNWRPPQSKFKNKPKELFEKARGALKEFFELRLKNIEAIFAEYNKDAERWVIEGEALRQEFNMLEAQSLNASKSELKRLKTRLLRQLETKKYVFLLGLHQYKAQVQRMLARSDIMTHFKEYKGKINQTYFRETTFEKEEDLFTWILLLQVILAFLPQEQETLALLPLRRTTVFFCSWMVQSSMGQENKRLYYQSRVRAHLRKVMTQAYVSLVTQAENSMSQERLALLQKTYEVLHQDTNFLKTSHEKMEVESDKFEAFKSEELYEKTSLNWPEAAESEDFFDMDEIYKSFQG